MKSSKRGRESSSRDPSWRHRESIPNGEIFSTNIFFFVTTLGLKTKVSRRKVSMPKARQDISAIILASQRMSQPHESDWIAEMHPSFTNAIIFEICEVASCLAWVVRGLRWMDRTASCRCSLAIVPMPCRKMWDLGYACEAC